MSTQLWVVFRRIRVAVFVISTILSMAWTILLAVLLLREWKTYNLTQHAILISLLVTNGVSTIILYLMIIVKFRLWLDGARVAILVLFQAGGTVTFALSNTSFPCNNIGTFSDCKTIESIITFGGWSLASLLLFYAFCLAFMSHVPAPPSPLNPEYILTNKLDVSTASNTSSSSVNSGTRLLNPRSEKHESTISNYSQASYIGPRTPPLSQQSSPSIRSPIGSASHWCSIYDKYGFSRSRTPLSIRSEPNYLNSAMGSPYSPISLFPPVPFGRVHYSSSRAYGLLLPNPFAMRDPVPRNESPVSVSSLDRKRFTTFGMKSPPSQASARHHLSPYPLPDTQGRLLVMPGTQAAVRETAAPSSQMHKHVVSPGITSPFSMSASIHLPRRGSALSVPRSPSPLEVYQSSIPSSPSSVLLSRNHPQLPKDDIRVDKLRPLRLTVQPPSITSSTGRVVTVQ